MFTDKQAPSKARFSTKAMSHTPLDSPLPLNTSVEPSDRATAGEGADVGIQASLEGSDLSAMPELPSPRLEDSFKRLGGLRDGLLVCGGIVYLLGRLIWAYEAQRFNLGIVPVEQSQYFVAGFVPAVILALVAFGIYGTKACLQIIGKLYVPDISRRRRLLKKILTGCYGIDAAVSLALWAGKYLWPNRHYLSPTSLSYTLSLVTVSCIFLAGLPLLVRVRNSQSISKMQFDYSDWMMTALYPIFIGVIAIYIYGGVVYPQLPQEYSGALPRVAYLDLDRTKVSPDTLSSLVPPEAMKSKKPILRTVLLDVFFTSKDLLLVKPFRNWRDNRTYELAGNSVLNRTWADPAKFRP